MSKIRKLSMTFFAIVASLLLAFSLVGVGNLAFAAQVGEDVAVSSVTDGENVTYHDSLQSAVDAAPNGATVTLLNSTTENVSVSKSLTLDLGKHTLSATTGSAVTVSTVSEDSETAVVITNGAIVAKGDTDTDVIGVTAFAVEANSKCTVTLTDSLTVTASENCVYAYGKAIVNTSAMLTSDGLFPAIQTDETSGMRGGTTVNVVGGSVTHANGTAIYFPSEKGTLNISGGVVSGKVAVEVRGGTVNVSGGELVAPGEYKASETTAEGRIYESGVALGIAKMQDREVSASVSNGSISAKEGGKALQVDAEISSFVSGGTFSQNIDASYIAEGSVVTDEGGTTTVVVGEQSDYVARIGTTGYDSLQSAVSAAQSGETVYLLRNVKIGGTVSVSQDIIIDLGGFIVTTTSGNNLFYVYSTATQCEIKNGTIVGIGTPFYLNRKDAKVTLSNLTVDYSGSVAIIQTSDYCTNLEIVVTGCDFTSQTAVVANLYGTSKTDSSIKGSSLTIVDSNVTSVNNIAIVCWSNTSVMVENGSIITATKAAAISNNGTNALPTEITINGGKVVGSTAIYHPGVGTLNVNGGEIIGDDCAIELRNGTLNVTDGIITAKTDFSETPNGSGSTITGAAIAISQHSTKGQITVNISGGELKYLGTDPDGKAFYETDIQNEPGTAPVPTISISGGKFAGGVVSTRADNYISGGNFTVAPGYSEFVDGYSVKVGEDGVLEVVQQSFVAVVDNVGYHSLQEAIGAAGSGETVTLLKDTSETVNIAEGKDIVLDLNGKTLTSDKASTATVSNDGTVRITSSVEGGKITRGTTKYYVILNHGTMTIDGAITVENTNGSDPSSLIDNGWYYPDERPDGKYAVLTIDGGEFVTATPIAIKNDEFGRLTVNGGTFTATNQSVQNWGYAELHGGHFTSLVIGWSYDNMPDDGIGTVIDGGKYDSGVGTIYSGATGNVMGYLVPDKASPLDISGGSFKAAIHYSYYADGHVADVTKVDAEGYVTVEANETGYVAAVGGVGYVDFIDALGALRANSTLTLLNNVQLGGRLQIDVNLNFDLNGYTITSTLSKPTNVLFAVVGSDVTVNISNGTFDGTGVFMYVYNNVENVKVNCNNLTLTSSNSAVLFGSQSCKNVLYTFTDCTLTNNTTGGSVAELNNSKAILNNTKSYANGEDSFNVLLFNNSAVEVNDGTEIYAPNGVGIYTNGSNTVETNIEINGGKVSAAVGIYQAGRGTLTVNGGEIIGVESGIELRAGTLNINSGTISATADFATQPNGSGTTVNGVAVAISQHSTKLPITVNISGGELKYLGTDPDGKAFYETDIQNEPGTAPVPTISISGGKFAGGVVSTRADNYISGGNFTVAPGYSEFVDGYSVKVGEDGVLEVVQQSFVAVVDNVGYHSLQEAIGAAGSGETVTLLKDTSETVNIAEGKDIVLDLNGKTLTSDKASTATVSNDGTVRITSSVEGGKITRGTTKYYVILNHGTMTIDGAITVENTNGSDPSSLIDNGWYYPDERPDGKYAVLTIDGGEFVTATPIAIKNDEFGRLTVNGGTFTATNQSVQNWGYAELHGGHFTSLVIGWSYDNMPDDGIGTVIDGGKYDSGVGTIYSGATGNVMGYLVPDKASPLDISGGSFKSAVHYSYYAEGFVADVTKVDEEGYATVVEGEYVALKNGIGYVSLQSAIDTVPTGETITLLCGVTESVVIPEGKEVTIDLNGKTITNIDGQHTITNNGTLTIEGVGTVDNVSHGKAALYNNGVAVLNGGVYSRSLEAGTATGANGNSWYTIFNDGDLTVNAGVEVCQRKEGTNNFSSLVENGYNKPATLTINGGTFTAGLNAVKNESGTVTIKDGTFLGGGDDAEQKSVLNWDTLEIHGGTFENVVQTWTWTDSTTGEGSHATTNIHNGTFNGGVVAETYHGEESPAPVVNITGGTFTGTVSGNKAEINVSAGTFTSAISATESKVTVSGSFDGEVSTDGNSTIKVEIDKMAMETVVYYIGAKENFVVATLEEVPEGAVLIAGRSEVSNFDGYTVDEDYIVLQEPDTGYWKIMDVQDFAAYAADYIAGYATKLAESGRYSAGGIYDLNVLAEMAASEMEKVDITADFDLVKQITELYTASMDAVTTRIDYEVALKEAKAQALADVRLYASLQGVALTDEITALVNGESVVAISQVSEGKLAAYDAIDALAQEGATSLDEAKENAVAEIIAAANAEGETAVVVPTATLHAIYDARTVEEVEIYRTNALAEIADIRTYRQQIDDLVNDTTVTDAIAALQSALLGDGEQQGKLAEMQAAFEAKIAEVQTTLATLATSEEVAQLKSDLQSYIDDAVEEFTTAISGLFEHITAMETSLTTLGASVTAVSGKVDAANTALTELQQALETLQGTVGGLNNVSMEEIQAAIDGATQQFSQAMQDMSADIGELKTTLTALGGSVTAVSDKVDVSNQALTTLQNAITTLQGTVDGLNNVSMEEIQSAITSATGELQSAISGIATDLDGLNQSLTTLSSDLATVGGNVTALNGTVATIQSAVTTLQSTVDGLNNVSLAEIQTAIDALETSVTQAITAAETAVTEQLTAISGKVDTLTGALATTSSSLTTQIGEIKEAIAAIEATSPEAIAQLNATLADIGTKLTALDQKVTALTAVEESKTEGKQEIDNWLNSYVESMLASVSVGKQKSGLFTTATAAELSTTLKDKLVTLFGTENAQLVEKYYSDALEAIDRAESVSDVNIAVSAFQTKVAMVEVVSGITSTTATQPTSDVEIFVLLAVAVVFGLVTVVLAMVVLSKRNK